MNNSVFIGSPDEIEVEVPNYVGIVQQGADLSKVTALPPDVLKGKVVVNQNGEFEGQMPINAPLDEVLDATKIQIQIPQGYHNGQGKVSIETVTRHIAPTKNAQTIYSPSGKVITLIQVDAIPNDYIIPQGEKEIAENGEYDVTEYAKVSVDVASSGGGVDDLIDGSTVEVNVPDATKIRQYALYQCSMLRTITMPNVTEIGDRAFQGCTSLELSDFPFGLTQIKQYAFLGCTSITKLKFPANEFNYGISSRAFYNCTNLEEVIFTAKPNYVLGISSSVFEGCTNLTTINVPWAEGEVANAPWGATNATINYNYTGE